MNRLIFNRSVLNTNILLRNYTVKSTSLAPPLRNIVKEPTHFVYKSVFCQLSADCFKQFYRKNSTYAPININTKNLTKDVIVFKYENPKYFKMMNFFGIIQFFFFLIASEFTLSTLRPTPIDENDPEFENKPFYFRVNLGENKYKYGISFASFMFGKFRNRFCPSNIFGWILSFLLINKLYFRFLNSVISMDNNIAKCTFFDSKKRWLKR